jgi:hypothetical protein
LLNGPASVLVGFFEKLPSFAISGAIGNTAKGLPRRMTRHRARKLMRIDLDD